MSGANQGVYEPRGMYIEVGVSPVTRYEVWIRNRARGSRRFSEVVSGTPGQLSRLLKPLRYAICTMRGEPRKRYVRDLCQSFRLWRRAQVNGVSR